MKHTYKPFPHNVTVKESSIHGLGLIATKTIPVGALIGISHYFTSEFGIVRSPIGGFLNCDTEDPSAFVIREDNVLNLFAARDIVEDEEITIDYRTAPCCTDNSDGDLENIIYWAYTGGHEYGSRRKKYVVHYTSDVDEIFEHIKRDKNFSVTSKL